MPTTPQDMDDDQLRAAFNRCARERCDAGVVRRAVIVRVVDAILDEALTRRNTWKPSI